MSDLAASPPAETAFDFTQPAELYVGRGNRRQQGLRYQSFETAADAIRHVVETPHAAGEVSTIECGDIRLGMRQIAELYNDPLYPLARRRTADASAEAVDAPEDTEIKSIAIPVTRRQPAARAAAALLAEKPVLRAAAAPMQQFPLPGAEPPAPTPIRAQHRFKVGDRLRMKQGGHSVARAAGYCRVVFLLPFEGAQLLYRVKSEGETFERVVAEADLGQA